MLISKGYRLDMKIPVPYSDILILKTGLSVQVSVKPIGKDHLIVFSRSQIILAVSRAIGQI